MRAEVYDRYQKERKEVYKKFGKKKQKVVLLILCIGLPVAALLIWIGSISLNGIPFAAVGALIIGIFTILYARIQTVKINHAMQKELLKLEDTYSLHSNL